MTLMAFPDGREELVQDSWRSDHHVLAECPICAGVTAFSKVVAIEHDGRLGSSTDDTGQGHVPWTGAVPPELLTAEDLGVFARRADGVWRRRDTRNRQYPVNKYGDRAAKPKTFAEGALLLPTRPVRRRSAPLLVEGPHCCS